MSKLTDELELSLDRLVENKMMENYSSRDDNEQWVYEDFANWLVKKFQEETKNG
jgi:hypothetical protein